MLELQRLTVPCPHRNYLGLPARTIRPFLSSNCFPNFPPFFPRKTGKAGKAGNISKVWKFKWAEYLQGFAFQYVEKKMENKQIQEIARKNSRNLDKNSFDKNGP